VKSVFLTTFFGGMVYHAPSIQECVSYYLGLCWIHIWGVCTSATTSL